MISVTRFHDFSCGHRVVNHESKCKHLHGHNYRVYFTLCASDGLDSIGRVLDFSLIKSILCEFLEKQWDHKMLLWEEDPLIDTLYALIPQDIVPVPFNPTAENMAKYLVCKVGPDLLRGYRVTLVEVVVEETRKCSATYKKDDWD